MAFGTQVRPDEKRMLLGRYNSARINLIFIAVLTLVNLVLLYTGDYTYFMFSASVPYILLDVAMYFCGLYPEEFYEGGYAAQDFFDPSVAGVVFGIAIVICLIYGLLFLLSKNGKVGFIIAAEVLFSIDTLVMFTYYGFDPTMLINIAFHIYAVVSFALAIHAHYKLKKILAAEAVALANAPAPEEGEAKTELPDSTAIRTAATDVKARVLLEAEVYGHKIVYRRVKKTNELVIDGNVYAEYTALAEQPHLLAACIDGHELGAGLDAMTSSSYIVADGNIVAKKIRWI